MRLTCTAAFPQGGKLVTKKPPCAGRLLKVVGREGFEPSTNGLKGHCSNH
jgi:hypothetical protein